MKHPSTAAHLPGPISSCSELPRAAAAMRAASAAALTSAPEAATGTATDGCPSAAHERAENTQRAANAARTLAVYAHLTASYEAEPREAAEHLLIDLMHLYDALGASFTAALSTANAHHQHELRARAVRPEPAEDPEAVEEAGTAPLTAPAATPDTTLTGAPAAVLQLVPPVTEAPQQAGWQQ